MELWYTWDPRNIRLPILIAHLGADLPVLTGLTQECSLIGPRHIITGHTGNTIAALDERPALKVLKEGTGGALAYVCSASRQSYSYRSASDREQRFYRASSSQV